MPTAADPSCTPTITVNAVRAVRIAATPNCSPLITADAQNRDLQPGIVLISEKRTMTVTVSQRQN
jgi:hypothetical protein